MKRQKWLLLGLMVVLALSWAPPAQASCVYFEFYNTGPGIVPIDQDYTTYNIRVNGLYGGWALDGTPGAPGLFIQEGAIHTLITASFLSFSPTPGEQGPPSIQPFPYGPLTGFFRYYIALDQSQPLPFADLSWEAKMVKDGVETTIFSLSADADLITHGGIKGGFVTFDLGQISIPVSWTYVADDLGWWGSGSSETDLTFTISQTGHVVPVPSSLVIFASGLVGLGGLGWRKMTR